MRYILLYLLLVNLIGAAVAAADKRKAQRNAWRIPEKTLFLFCLLGGCPGVYTSMKVCHHKTRHKRFMWGIPAIFVLQIALIALYFLKFRKGL